MKKILVMATVAMMTLCVTCVRANDGVFYVNGNHLVPVHETDIVLTKEVLTIRLCDDGYARVDVQYELDNPGSAKTVVMGFEASAPYNDDVPFSPQGIHPYIADFTVHHTYRYRMSYGVGRTFEVPYWLKPAMRWRGGQIGDFTLRIKATNTAKHFFLPDSLFSASTFTITEGTGKMRRAKVFDDSCTEFTLRNGTVEWHATNFKPQADITIQSAESLNYDHFILGTFYDRSDSYMPGSYMLEMEKISDRERILRNLPYAHRGYIFKDKKLRNYFSQFWWYMPDADYQPSTDDFTAREWKLINEHQFVPLHPIQ